VDDVITIPTPAGEVAQAGSPVSLLSQSAAAAPDLAQQAATLGLNQDGTVSDTADVAALWQLAASAAPDQMARYLHQDGDRVDGFLLLFV
jgi:hypothetical protein